MSNRPMSNNLKAFFAVLVVLVLGGGGYLYLNGSDLQGKFATGSVSGSGFQCNPSFASVVVTRVNSKVLTTKPSRFATNVPSKVAACVPYKK